MSLKLSSRPKNKVLRFGTFELDFSKKIYLMGVLNITPDSFSDGGLFLDKVKAIERAVEMSVDGADIIDIGGESTRPGSESISAEEELKRVLPVIKALAQQIKVPISIDTSKPYVAKEALKAGASIINNIMGSNLDRRMASVAAEFDAPIVLMHIKGMPRTMQANPVYKDLIGEITTTLKGSIETAEASGVDPQKIIIDPGVGFGKTAAHNLEILKRLREFEVLNRPILIGPSRKSFIGSVLNIDIPSERLMGTAAAVAIAAANGANIIRVHDVKEMAQVTRLVKGIYK